MIESDKTQLDKELKLIDEALQEGGKMYKSCLIWTNFTTELDNKIDTYKSQLVHISQEYDPTVNLTRNVEGQILTLMGQIGNLEKEKNKMQRRAGELWNIVGPQLDTLVCHKMECLQNMTQEAPSCMQ